MHFRKSLFVLFVIGFVFLSSPAFALQWGNFFYEVSASDNVTITGYTWAGGAVVIPATIDSKPVVGIGFMAFADFSAIPSVTIPAGVKSIGVAAFLNCSGLTSIVVDAGNTVYSSHGGVLYNKAGTVLIQYPCGKAGGFIIPGSVTSIGNYAFACCHHLTSVAIPDSVTSIGKYAFDYCTGLTSVTIPDSVKSLGEAAFYDCTNLTSIDVAAGNTAYSSQDGVLYNKAGTVLIQYPCAKAGDFTIPDSVTSIRDSAFAGCTGLTEVTIPDSMTSIGNYVFTYCTGLTSVTIPDTVTSIGEHAFSGCTGLTEITIPGSVTSIGDEAFSGCTGLTSVTIPGSVVSIGERAFYFCTGLTGIVVDAGNTAYSSQDGVLYNKDKTELIQYPAQKPGWFFMLYSVTSIGYGAFAGCDGLSRVYIPGSVTSIGVGAFYLCTHLTGAYFSGDAPIMVASVFNGCAPTFTVYYRDGAAGFTNPWYGYPTAVFTPQTCPAMKVLGADNPKLDYLRAFRDNMLVQSTIGRKIIQIYYTNADSINDALEHSPALRAAVRRGLEVFAPILGKN